MKATKVVSAAEAHAEGEGGRVITAVLPSRGRSRFHHHGADRTSPRVWIPEMSQYLPDPTDPFQMGFTVGDIWAR